MKQAMTSVDVAVVVSELQHLIGSRIEKIYKTDTGTDIEQIRLNLYLFGDSGRMCAPDRSSASKPENAADVCDDASEVSLSRQDRLD